LEWPQLAEGVGDDAVYYNPTALGRVRFAVGPKIGDADAAFAALTAPMRRGPVDDGADIVEPSAEDSNAIQGGSGEAAIAQETPERIEIAVRCDQAGVLVLADRMTPGWTVTVDGVSKPALTVDYLFRRPRRPPHRRLELSRPGLSRGSVDYDLRWSRASSVAYRIRMGAIGKTEPLVRSSIPKTGEQIWRSTLCRDTTFCRPGIVPLPHAL
jgi:hypothetical protein